MILLESHQRALERNDFAGIPPERLGLIRRVIERNYRVGNDASKADDG